MAVDDMPFPKIREALRTGSISRDVATEVKLEKRQRKLAEARVVVLENRLKDAADEASQLAMELRQAHKELARFGAE